MKGKPTKDKNDRGGDMNKVVEQAAPTLPVLGVHTEGTTGMIRILCEI